TIFGIAILTSASCNKNKNNNGDPDNPIDSTQVMGFNMLAKLPGIWGGAVTSSTALGGFPEWIVDFRPVSAAQVSGKSELNSNNDIFLSFFVAKHENQYKLAFRNGGFFAGNYRITYQIIDSVFEDSQISYYRFSDFKKGTNRVYSEIIFKADSLILKTFTNKYNSLTEAVIHMDWRARLADSTSTQQAKAQFDFPKKQMVFDFTNTFNDAAESVFFNVNADPYPQHQQPYLGKTTITVADVEDRGRHSH